MSCAVPPSLRTSEQVLTHFVCQRNSAWYFFTTSWERVKGGRKKQPRHCRMTHNSFETMSSNKFGTLVQTDTVILGLGHTYRSFSFLL